MNVSIIVCTWNRAELLGRTLARFCELDIPAQVNWEVLVVDNGSTDATSDVLATFAHRLPLRALGEPARGKSRAANRAIRAARGDLLLWTDDDVLVERGWLAAYVEAAQQAPRAAFFGGPIAAEFLQPPPPWLMAAWPVVAVAYAERQLGPQAKVLASANELPFGANMVTRRAVHEQFAFDEKLGPTGNGHVRGEEIDVLARFLLAGHTGQWVPAAAVRHLIPPARATREYLAAYFYGAGQQRTLVQRRHAGYGLESASVPVWLKACWADVKYRVTRGLCRPQTAMRHFCQAQLLWGQASSV